MKLLCLFACLLFTSASCGSDTSADQPAQATTTTVILVRHAEKEDGDDPELTAAGRERAARLASLLADSTLTAVYSTDTRRTRATAGPSAENSQLEIQVYDPNELSGLADRVRKRHAGGTVLIVGHSNTTPALANQFTGSGQLSPFSEDDYGNILVVTIPGNGTPRLEERRY